jgi:hypothetical protein
MAELPASLKAMLAETAQRMKLRIKNSFSRRPMAKLNAGRRKSATISSEKFQKLPAWQRHTNPVDASRLTAFRTGRILNKPDRERFEE